MISDETVERVRSAADIVQIIQEFVPLKRMGDSFRGACPFHGGTKANFSVNQKRSAYHCFVCHESGDVFTFVRKRLGLDWPSAVKMIGDRVGIEVIDTPARQQVADPNERNWEVLATAAEWFRRQLEDAVVGRDAREYLEGRGLDLAARTRFGLGFAPRDAVALRRYLHSLGFDDARQLEAGLLMVREGETEPRMRFGGRVMFPIVDELGHHVAFGGRSLGDATPKYLNSGESAVFQKRRTLYGLHSAKQAMRRNSRAIVVEGYLDAIRLALAGVEEVVAPLGTALTEEQAQLLVRYASEVFLLYDSDEAGQKATFRSGLELLRNKAAVRVVSLPQGDDPDSFVRAHGRPALEAQLSKAIDLFDRQIQVLERLGWFNDLRKRRLAIDKLLPTIRAARDPLTRDLYLTRLADVSHLDKAIIASEADEPPAGSREARQNTAATRDGDPGPDPSPFPDRESNPVNDGGQAPPSPYAALQQRGTWKGKRGKNAGPEWQATNVPPRARTDEPVERSLIRAMLIDRGLVERVAERHAPADFRDDSYRAIFQVMLDADHDDDLEQIAERLDPAPLRTLRVLTELADGSESLQTDVALSLDRLDARRLEARVDEILNRLRVSQSSEESDRLMRERLDLEVELRRLSPIRSPRPKPKR